MAHSPGLASTRDVGKLGQETWHGLAHVNQVYCPRNSDKDSCVPKLATAEAAFAAHLAQFYAAYRKLVRRPSP